MNFVRNVLCLIALIIAACYIGNADAQAREPASGDWYDQIYTESSTHRMYVGGAYSFNSSEKALKAAYKAAIEEAVNHNFGFTASNVQRFYQDKNSVEIKDSSHVYSDIVRLDGITTAKRKVFKKSDGTYDAFVQIAYDKAEIDKEKNRLEGKVGKATPPDPLVIRPEELKKRYANDFKDHFLRFAVGFTDANYVDNMPGAAGAASFELGYQYRLFNSRFYADGFFRKGGSSSPSNIDFSQLGLGLTYDFSRVFYGGAYYHTTSYSFSRNESFLDTSGSGLGVKAGAKLDLSQLGAPVTFYTEVQIENTNDYRNTNTNLNLQPDSALNGGVSLGIKFGF